MIIMKNKMPKYAPALAAAAVFFFMALPAAAELNAEDKAATEACHENVRTNNSALSPVKAAECIELLNADNYRLLNALQAENERRAAFILSRNSALADLSDIVRKYHGVNLSNAMSRLFYNKSCAICDMGLGQKADLPAAWVGTHHPGRKNVYELAVYTWDAMWAGRRTGLEAMGNAAGSWAEMTIPKRNEQVSKWAVKQADELLSTNKMAESNLAAAAGYEELVRELKKDLYSFKEYERARNLDDLVRNLREKADAKAKEKAPEAPKVSEKKGGEMDAAAGKLGAAKAAGSEEAFLAGAFDKAASVGGAVGLPGGAGMPGLGKPGQAGAAGRAEFKPVPVTDRQASQITERLLKTDKDGKLTGYIADEMRGTKAGDEIIAFYEDPVYGKAGTNKLNFKIKKGEGKLANANGWWDGNELVVTHAMVDRFAADRGVTPKQMLESEALMKDFATYTAPVFVHEGTHQRQTAWEKSLGIDKFNAKEYSPYTMEKETEAFSMNAAFVAEKAKKGGAGYLSKIHEGDRADAERFLEDGVDGIRDTKHTYGYYSQFADSVNGAAAKSLTDARQRADYVDYLQRKKASNPKGMSRAENEALRAYTNDLDTRFKWYRAALADSKEDERKLLAWRTELDSDGKLRDVLRGQ